MSGVAAVFERTGAPVPPGALDAVLQMLTHRGPDGCDSVTQGSVAMGHCHFWTTPEEVGEHQPLRADRTPITLALDGRVDNRKELAEALDIGSPELRSISDAKLVLLAYERWGDGFVDRLIGEFAIVVHDARSGELILARDAMGERSLFYRHDADTVLVASEPAAIAGAARELDQQALACFFAFELPPDGRTLYRDVRELRPGEVVTIGCGATRTRLYWEPDFERRLRGLPDSEYAERFFSLLEESVRCRMRASTAVGVQMSGGLDSGSVASIAARLLAPERLTTISWIFDDLSECDERQYIDAMKARWNIRSLQVPGDEAWPLRQFDSWPQTPNHPELNPYRLLKLGVFRKASEEGIRVLMTGCYSDQLYDRAADWLAELLFEGRIAEAVSGCFAYARRFGPARFLGSPSLRRVARRLVGERPVRPREREAGRSTHPWLAPNAENALRTAEREEGRHAAIGRTLTRFRAHESTGHLGQAQLELRHPFRDRRLVEFVLSLPAYQMFNKGLRKHVLRTAMRGVLPDSIRARSTSSPLTALYRRGFGREESTCRELLEPTNAGWRAFVNPTWLDENRNRIASDEEGGVELLVPWACATFEMWKNSFDLSIMPHGADDAAN